MKLFAIAIHERRPAATLTTTTPLLFAWPSTRFRARRTAQIGGHSASGEAGENPAVLGSCFHAHDLLQYDVKVFSLRTWWRDVWPGLNEQLDGSNDADS